MSYSYYYSSPGPHRGGTCGGPAAHAWCEGHRKWWRCQYRIEMYHIHPHDIGNDG